METITYKSLTITELPRIKGLWEELNRIHLADSIYFKDHYTHFSFEERIKFLVNKHEKDIQLLVAETEELTLAGYCISTISENKMGEIDSLFVDAAFRKQGIGTIFMKKSMEWLQANQCNPIRLNVSYGHERVFGYYQRLGFYPRLTTLELRNTEI